jgi:uncharacterized protein DUF5343
MPESLPYLVTPRTAATALQKMKAAATPERFTQDFLANTLGMKGGSPKPIIPFLKRIGFLGTDAAPTELYKAFRNAGQSGVAVAQAMRIGYKALFDMNERAHELPDPELKGLVVQATGLEEKSRVVQLILQTFKILKQHAAFGATAIQVKKEEPRENSAGTKPPSAPEDPDRDAVGIHLSYTINLNLPPTPDITVFNAIFKALRDNLLR